MPTVSEPSFEPPLADDPITPDWIDPHVCPALDAETQI